MFEKIINLDKKLLILINNLGDVKFDFFWISVTNPLFWIPFFLVLLFLIWKKLGTKQTLILLIFAAILVTFTDQTSNFFKHYFKRLRPCNDLTINELLRIIKPSSSYSFFSGHSATSMGVTVFLFSLFRKNYNLLWLIFIWPILFAFSRMYLGLHFPTDVLCGYLCGCFYGFLFYKIYVKFVNPLIKASL